MLQFLTVFILLQAEPGRMKNRFRLFGVALLSLSTVSAISLFSSSTDSAVEEFNARDEDGVQPLPASAVSVLPEGFTMPEQGT